MSRIEADGKVLVTVARAVAMRSSEAEEPPTTVIEISGEVPDFRTGDFANVARMYYEDQAKMVVDALSSLPGGTLDRVLVRLMERKASLFRVQS